jgi:methyl-accepting chemotaxis protein
MRRVFLKLFLLVVLVVGVSTAALDLFIRQSWEASLSPALKHRFEKQLLEASGIGLLSGLVVALIAAQSVSRRLHKMVGFAQEIAAGHLAARLPESGTDELAMLAITLDQTAANSKSVSAASQTAARKQNPPSSMDDAVVTYLLAG